MIGEQPARKRQGAGAPAAVRRLEGEAATEALAAALAPAARPRDVIALFGGLGAGKTVFARAFIRARCGAATEVPSPTFTLVQVYEPVPPHAGAVWHFDLYRLTDPDDAYELGLEDALAEGVTLVEWPERLGPLLPDARLDVCLAHGAAPDERTATLVGHGAWRARLEDLALA